MGTSDPNFAAVYAGELIMLRELQGRLAEIQPLIDMFASSYPAILSLRIVDGLARLELGREEEAREIARSVLESPAMGIRDYMELSRLAWAVQLADLYFSGTTAAFILHGNTDDLFRVGPGDVPRFGVLSEFLAEQGWGRLTALLLGPAVLALDSTDWAEALDEPQGEYPSCHLSCGLLADFLGRISQGLVAVMEVECRSRGETRCRFLAGSPETLGILYERMAQGSGYLEALAGDGRR